MKFPSAYGEDMRSLNKWLGIFTILGHQDQVKQTDEPVKFKITASSVALSQSTKDSSDSSGWQ